MVPKFNKEPNFNLTAAAWPGFTCRSRFRASRFDR